MIDPTQPMRLAPDVVLQMVGGEALLLKLHDEAVFSLNETGARIAQLLSQGHSFDAMADILSDEYGIDRAEVMQDAGELVETLVTQKLVVVAQHEHR